jgi:UDP-N-acetyl-D-glucosamine dehydrogenase
LRGRCYTAARPCRSLRRHALPEGAPGAQEEEPLSDGAADRKLAIIGLGYVGLPLAIDLVEAGFDVQGIDASSNRVARLRDAQSYVDDVADDRLRAALDTGRLALSGIDASWAEASVAFICVPTPVTATLEPDLGPILAAAGYVRDGLRGGDLVVLQSTTYPGTTVGPLRAALEAGGLRAGVDFGLAFAPERVSPGEGRPASSIPRLVGGIDVASGERAASILATVSPDVRRMSSPDAAELAKLFENVFRNVNIALVNELALICERLGLDVWEVIGGASTKPFGFMAFLPGPGVGGHCIPVDPYYLAARAREVGFHERFVETAGDINSQMPEHVVRLVAAALNRRGKPLLGARILVIGVAFKSGVSDARNSPAGPIIEGLAELGAAVSYHDPRLPTFSPAEAAGRRADAEGTLRSVELAPALASRPDCVLILTAHPEVDWDAVLAEADLVVDTRNVSAEHRVEPGQVLRLGAGWS